MTDSGAFSDVIGAATLASGALHGFNNLLKSSKELNMRLAKYHSLEVKLERLRSNERLLVVGQNSFSIEDSIIDRILQDCDDGKIK